MRAITSETGSWIKFLYRGPNAQLSSSQLTLLQLREGAIEKVRELRLVLHCTALYCSGPESA